MTIYDPYPVTWREFWTNSAIDLGKLLGCVALLAFLIWVMFMGTTPGEASPVRGWR